MTWTAALYLALYTSGCYAMAYAVTASFIEHPARGRKS